MIRKGHGRVIGRIRRFRILLGFIWEKGFCVKYSRNHELSLIPPPVYQPLHGHSTILIQIVTMPTFHCSDLAKRKCKSTTMNQITVTWHFPPKPIGTKITVLELNPWPSSRSACLPIHSLVSPFGYALSHQILPVCKFTSFQQGIAYSKRSRLTYGV